MIYKISQIQTVLTFNSGALFSKDYESKDTFIDNLIINLGIDKKRVEDQHIPDGLPSNIPRFIIKDTIEYRITPDRIHLIYVNLTEEDETKFIEHNHQELKKINNFLQNKNLIPTKIGIVTEIDMSELSDDRPVAFVQNNFLSTNYECNEINLRFNIIKYGRNHNINIITSNTSSSIKLILDVNNYVANDDSDSDLSNFAQKTFGYVKTQLESFPEIKVV